MVSVSTTSAHTQRLVAFVLLRSTIFETSAAPANGSYAALLSGCSIACGVVFAELRKHFCFCVCVLEWVAANVVAKYSIVVLQFILFCLGAVAMRGCKRIRIEYLMLGKCLLFLLSLLQGARVRLECFLWSRYGFLG